METYYYGLTIGPIYKTITQVRATRELWGASYLFSELMRRFLVGVSQHQDILILSPAISVPEGIGVGLFPDQCYLRGTDKAAKDIQDAIIAAKGSIASEMAADLKKGGWLKSSDGKDQVHQFLQSYLQTYLVRLKHEGESIPTKRLQLLMANAELRPPFQREEAEEQAYLRNFLYMINRSSMKKAAYGEESGEIPSLPEIAVQELLEYYTSESQKASEQILNDWQKQGQAARQKESESLELMPDDKKYRELIKATRKREEPEKLLKQLSDNEHIKPHLKNYHKYVAVVQADGDNISKSIATLGNSSQKYQDLSTEMLEFGVKASTMIKDFKGLPVYIGGDDLLFFAPVKYKEQTIFDLITDLDELFQTSISFKNPQYPPSLSFGVSISYYKFPLYEALDRSHILLDYQAKTFPSLKGVTPYKNALAFQLLKHSGQEMGQVLPMGKGKVFEVFIDLLGKQLKDSDRLLSSVAYKIGKYEKLIDSIGLSKDRLTNFFDQNFNESIHESYAQEGGYLDGVRDLVNAAYRDAASFFPAEAADKQGEYARKTIYSLLRTLHFITQDYYDND